MKIKTENSRIILDNSGKCIGRCLILFLCVAMSVGIVIEKKENYLDIIITFALLAVAFVSGILRDCVSSFVIEQNGITVNRFFLFRCHIGWSQIKEYYAENGFLYRSSVPTHRRFVFVYGEKYKTILTPYFPAEDKSAEEQIRSFCDGCFKK